MTNTCNATHPVACHPEDGSPVQCTLDITHEPGRHEDHSREQDGEVITWHGLYGLDTPVAVTHGHTPGDYDELVRKGIDPSTRQPREQPVVCPAGDARHRHTAMNLSGRCDAHATRYVGGF